MWMWFGWVFGLVGLWWYWMCVVWCVWCVIYSVMVWYVLGCDWFVLLVFWVGVFVCCVIVWEWMVIVWWSVNWFRGFVGCCCWCWWIVCCFDWLILCGSVGFLVLIGSGSCWNIVVLFVICCYVCDLIWSLDCFLIDSFMCFLLVGFFVLVWWLNCCWFV